MLVAGASADKVSCSLIPYLNSVLTHEEGKINCPFNTGLEQSTLKLSSSTAAVVLKLLGSLLLLNTVVICCKVGIYGGLFGIALNKESIYISKYKILHYRLHES